MKNAVCDMKNAVCGEKCGLIYYMHDGSAAFRFRLAGDLSGDSTRELEQAWQTASSIIGGRRLVVDLTGVRNIDAAGGELLEKWGGLGAHLIVASQEAKLRIQPITTVPIEIVRMKPKLSKRVNSPMAACLVALLVILWLASSLAASVQENLDPPRQRRSANMSASAAMLAMHARLRL